MKKDSELYKNIRVQCYIVGLIAFLTALIVGVFLLHNLEKDEKTTGKYMAQITEKRVRARLDQYSMLSALLGNYISAGCEPPAFYRECGRRSLDWYAGK